MTSSFALAFSPVDPSFSPVAFSRYRLISTSRYHERSLLSFLDSQRERSIFGDEYSTYSRSSVIQCEVLAMDFDGLAMDLTIASWILTHLCCKYRAAAVAPLSLSFSLKQGHRSCPPLPLQA